MKIRVASPECVPIYLKYYIDPKYLGSSACANSLDTDQTIFDGHSAPQSLALVYTVYNSTFLARLDEVQEELLYYRRRQRRRRCVQKV